MRTSGGSTGKAGTYDQRVFNMTHSEMLEGVPAG